VRAREGPGDGGPRINASCNSQSRSPRRWQALVASPPLSRWRLVSHARRPRRRPRSERDSPLSRSYSRYWSIKLLDCCERRCWHERVSLAENSTGDGLGRAALAPASLDYFFRCWRSVLALCWKGAGRHSDCYGRCRCSVDVRCFERRESSLAIGVIGRVKAGVAQDLSFSGGCCSVLKFSAAGRFQSSRITGNGFISKFHQQE
jgi:hypothetical protein